MAVRRSFHASTARVAARGVRRGAGADDHVEERGVDGIAHRAHQLAVEQLLTGGGHVVQQFVGDDHQRAALTGVSNRFCNVSFDSGTASPSLATVPVAGTVVIPTRVPIGTLVKPFSLKIR